MQSIESLLKKLEETAKRIQPLVPSYYLAELTAIAFKHRHRKSYDLDFFSERYFSKRHLFAKLSRKFDIGEHFFGEDNLDVVINNTKVSFVYFPFKNIKRLERLNNLRIASDYDLFLNKVYSSGRRVEYKDAFDVAFLYDRYRWDLSLLKKDFEKKFKEQKFEIYLSSLADFESYDKMDKKTKEIIEDLISKLY